MVSQVPEHCRAFGQTRTVQALGRRPELGEFLRGDADELAQGVRLKPPAFAPLAGLNFFEWSEALFDSSAYALCRSPLATELGLHFVDRHSPAPGLEKNGQVDDVLQAFEPHRVPSALPLLREFQHLSARTPSLKAISSGTGP